MGIPLVLILLIVAIALLVNVPMVALHSANMDVQKELIREQQETNNQVLRVKQLLEVTPTVTPEVTVSPTPTRSVNRTVTTRPSSPSAN